MSITQTIAADQAAVDAAQVVLNAAMAQLAADNAKLTELQPVLGALGEVEAYLIHVADEAKDGFMAALNKVKGLF